MPWFSTGPPVIEPWPLHEHLHCVPKLSVLDLAAIVEDGSAGAPLMQVRPSRSLVGH